jgi:hypothetical protein
MKKVITSFLDLVLDNNRVELPITDYYLITKTFI